MTQRNRTRIEDYPLFLNVRDIMEITRLSKNNIYTLIKADGCPAYQPDGQKKYLIPRDLFFEWVFNRTKVDGYLKLI